MRFLLPIMVLSLTLLVYAKRVSLLNPSVAADRLQPPTSGLNINNLIYKRDPSVTPGLCDDVHSLAGYYNVGHNKSYFYWIFESRNDWKTDPIVLWMTGGPGCSSQIALFYENGPCIINDDHNTTRPNPYGWNSNSSIIYIDQPEGVGFSTGKVQASNETDVANQMYEFLSLFLAANKELQNNDFWIFGESYGGHYIPAVATKIVQENEKGLRLAINFKGVGIGNGLTNPLVQYEYYAKYAINNPVRPLVSNFAHKLMTWAWPLCKSYVSRCEKDRDPTTCSRGLSVCMTSQLLPIKIQGINQYDVRKKCEMQPLCYNMTGVSDFLNQPHVRKALGVSMDIEWTECSMDIIKHFTVDFLQSFEDDVKLLLRKGKQVLIYAGEDDFICNYLGNKAWVSRMDWPYKSEWNQKPDARWLVNGEEHGLVRSYGNLTFLQVYDAGHM
eukprot:Ihof_evm8s3 gene=Ihof_evmTU8s3